jgi:ribosome-associated protein
MLESDALARAVFEAMADKQAEDLVIMDLRPVSLLADFFVIATVGNPRQMRAVVEAALETARDKGGVRDLASEGTADSGWVLVDFGSVIVHVFDPQRREYYDLESMWAKAPLVARMA